MPQPDRVQREEEAWRLKARFLLAFGGSISYERYDEMTPREVAVYVEELVESNKARK